jgi:MTH538 TIR-like domain (DUF1863)
VFHSFHFKQDSHRVSQVRNMGVIEGQTVLSGNEWEKVKQQGDKAVEDWIDENMKGRSCVVVLIGAETAGRKWVKHEIIKGWSDKRGVVGVHIHGLKNLAGNQGSKGANPFTSITVGGKALSTIVKVYDPPYSASTNVYTHIKENLDSWVEEAIEIRSNY